VTEDPPMVPLRTSLMYDMPCYFCGLPMKAQEVYEQGVRIIHTGSRSSCAHRFIPKEVSSPVERQPMRWPPATPVVKVVKQRKRSKERVSA
jgi:hypothetical protein